MSKVVLVTGGAGYIGSHVCQHLEKQGYTPVTYDNLQGGHRSSVQFGPFVYGNIHDVNALVKTINTYKPSAIFHFASSINVRQSLIDPALYYDNNVVGTLRVLEAMVQTGLRSLIFSSTASVYGPPKYTPIDEAHPKAPTHPYGKSKYIVELMLQDFEKAHGIHSVCLRYFNAAGADPEGKIGEAHFPETHLIPLVIQTALGIRTCLDIYGNSYPTPDGTAIRDYIHVVDLAEAHLKALEWVIKKNESIQLNLGTGSGYSIQEVLQTAERVIGKKINTSLQAPSPDAAILIASSALAKETLNWYPKHSSLENIITTALAWHKKFL